MDIIGSSFSNFFLSRNKGENISMQIECAHKEKAIQHIRDSFYSFLERKRVEQSDVQLPLNQLFLDFPYNTLQIWDHNPFRKGILVGSVQVDNDYLMLLSNKCLRVLSSEEQWDEAISFQIYIELLFVITVYLKENLTVEPGLILKKVMTDLFNRSKGNDNLINRIQLQGKDIYRQNKSGIHGYHHQIHAAISSNNVNKDWINDWLSIIEAKLQLLNNPKDKGQVINAIKEIVFDTSQKIDLAQKGLIQAISVIDQFIGFKD